MYKYLFNNQSLKDRRRELRKNQTGAENKLWECLRGKRLGGLKFHRQYSVGPYILDFYCSRLRLGIEIDGSQHTETDSKLYDKDREKVLRESNIRVVRFWNYEIENDIDRVLDKILKEANSSNSS